MHDARKTFLLDSLILRITGGQNFTLMLLMALLIFSGCSKKPVQLRKHYGILEKHPGIWSMTNSRIEHFEKIYSRNSHVRTCLKRASEEGYLNYIHRVFFKYRLPPELAHLPLLESCFDKRADSGKAMGMWQFTKETAKDYGLRVGWFSDDRLNWRKSTHSAAQYLNELGKRFNFDWYLVLAGYNGGPNYIAKAIKRQKTQNFWELKLNKETSEYVPKFLAMLRVGRGKYPELFFEGAPKYLVASS